MIAVTFTQPVNSTKLSDTHLLLTNFMMLGRKLKCSGMKFQLTIKKKELQVQKQKSNL